MPLEQKVVIIKSSTGQFLCGGPMNIHNYLHNVMKYTNWLDCSVLAEEIWEQAIEDSVFVGCGPTKIKVSIPAVVEDAILWDKYGEVQANGI